MQHSIRHTFRLAPHEAVRLTGVTSYAMAGHTVVAEEVTVHVRGGDIVDVRAKGAKVKASGEPGQSFAEVVRVDFATLPEAIRAAVQDPEPSGLAS